MKNIRKMGRENPQLRGTSKNGKRRKQKKGKKKGEKHRKEGTESVHGKLVRTENQSQRKVSVNEDKNCAKSGGKKIW